MKLINDHPFDSEMLMNTIVMYQDNEHFENLNCFKEDEHLDTLDKDELVRRLDKSFDIKLEKVRKILKKDLDQTDLVKLAHCTIEVANQKCGPQKRKHPESSATHSSFKKRKTDEPSVSDLCIS
jgi:energy-converting hydrogenase A subunit M